MHREFLRACLAALLFFLCLPATHATDSGEVDYIVAVVDDTVILASELDSMLRTVVAQLRQQNTELPPANILRRQVLERLIMNKLQLGLAKRSGITVDDETLNQAVASIAAENRLTMEQFRAVLARDGYDYARFRETIRDQITVTRLQQRQINSLVNVTDREVDNFLANQAARGGAEDEYHLAHILIGLPEGATPDIIQKARAKADKVLAELRGGANFQRVAVAVSDAQQALEGGDLGWRTAAQIPSLFIDIVKNLEVGAVSDLVRSPSGFHIIKLVDKRGMSQHIVKQTQARHILIRSNELVSNAEARTRLDQLRERIEGGEDFTSLARANSDDTASAAKGGELGWISPGTMVPEFEEAMNKLAPGEISAPFQTQFGWHIVQVQARRDHDNTEEFLRSRAREAIRARKTEEELEIWMRRLRDEAYVEIRLPE